MNLVSGIFMVFWRSFSWILFGFMTVLQGPVALFRLVAEVMGRIIIYSFGWIL
jgi:hypothetical protein